MVLAQNWPDAGSEVSRQVLQAGLVCKVGDGEHELAFADRTHLLWARGTVARAAVDEHGRYDVVPRVEVGQKLVEQIAAARVIPEPRVSPKSPVGWSGTNGPPIGAKRETIWRVPVGRA